MEIINKYKVWKDVVDFLKAIDPDDEMNSVEERKLYAMYEVLHNVHKDVPVIPLDVVTSFINNIDRVEKATSYRKSG